MDLNTLIITFFLLFTLISNFPFMVQSSNCSISNCGDLSSNPKIRYPFRVKNSGHPPNSCGKPGFDVWCDGKSNYSTLIELPNSGNFSVKSIDYGAQEIWINDPTNCLPKRFLTFNLSGSPFAYIYYQHFSFFNCSKTLNLIHLNKYIGPIKCLSGSTYSIYAIPYKNGTLVYNQMVLLLSRLNCSIIAPLVKVPVQWPSSLHDNTVLSLSSELHDDLRLSWYMPECRSCELKGQMCGLETDSSGSDVIVCSNDFNQGKDGKFPLAASIAAVLAICSPLIICVVASVIILIRGCYIRHSPRRSVSNSQTGTGGVPLADELGLAQLNIAFAREVFRLGQNEEPSPDYQPTIVISELEEVGQGPNGENENTCAICMGEYRRKDRIGSLPACGHYFHANCINKWLLSRGRFRSTCPICRANVDSSSHS